MAAPTADPVAHDHHHDHDHDHAVEKVPSKSHADMAGLTDLASANFPRDAEGRVYHLSVKEGEVANRIVCVGSVSRAETISKLLDTIEMDHCSHRGFRVFTGTKNGKRVSVIATGMGIPMTDFVMREVRAVVAGPMVVVRLGTCGSPHPNVPVGSIGVATQGSVGILRNPDAFHADPPATGGSNLAVPRCLGPYSDPNVPYHLTKLAPSDPGVGSLLVKNLQAAAERDGKTSVHEGANASACSFYSSQGRTDERFADRNASLVDELMDAHPNIVTLEMESFHMFDLARIVNPPVRACACTIVLAQRKHDDFLPFDRLKELEVVAGAAVLETVANVEMEGGY